jgi:localization factor PodJL
MNNRAFPLIAGAPPAPDPRAALHWFHAAAEHGVKDSQYNLGVIYSRGIGVSVDRREAYKWFAIAAASGDEDAAAQRDQVAATLDPNALSLARAASSAFRPKAPPPGAADVATGAPVMAAEVASPAPDVSGETPGIAFESRQAMVRIAQELLAERGFDPGPVDGLEGPKTIQAVRAFQRSIGAASTGRIDEPLVVRLSQQIG